MMLIIRFRSFKYFSIFYISNSLQNSKVLRDYELISWNYQFENWWAEFICKFSVLKQRCRITLPSGPVTVLFGSILILSTTWVEISIALLLIDHWVAIRFPSSTGVVLVWKRVVGWWPVFQVRIVPAFVAMKASWFLKPITFFKVIFSTFGCFLIFLFKFVA